MTSKKTFLILLIFFYLITFFKTILLLFIQIYIPNFDYMTSLLAISHEFTPYAQIIKIIFIVLAFSIIPGFYILKKNIKENNPYYKKIHILISMLAFTPAILALLNNFITADFLLSIALLLYGILFMVLAYKFR